MVNPAIFEYRVSTIKAHRGFLHAQEDHLEVFLYGTVCGKDSSTPTLSSIYGWQTLSISRLRSGMYTSEIRIMPWGWRVLDESESHLLLFFPECDFLAY